mgnify:CR=1 FL=1
MGKQVITPRFYVDMPTFLHATGQLGWDDYQGGAELLYMNCANPYINDTQDNFPFAIGHPDNNTPKTSFPINFCALLNHNLASDSNTFTTLSYIGIDEGNQSTKLERMPNYTNILNSTGHNNDPTYNGTSIWTFDEISDYWRTFGVYYGETPEDYQRQLGSLVVGKYWDAPYSPDLNLTMSRSFDGIKKQRTIGGKTLANIYYDGPTEWTMHHPEDGTYKYPPFELDDVRAVSGNTPITKAVRAKSGLGRKGLRSWKLSFSYIDEDNMWMAYENSSGSPFKEFNNIEVGDTHEITGGSVVPSDNGEIVVNYFDNKFNPMLEDNSFNFVWNCTLGGTLPFIFQPDNTNNNTDQFSICTFRDSSLSVQQVAHNTYRLNVTIDEVA